MVYKKQPSGSQRTLIYKIRVRPHFQTLIDERLEQLRKIDKYKDLTTADLIRRALDKYFRPEGDPREP